MPYTYSREQALSNDALNKDSSSSDDDDSGESVTRVIEVGWKGSTKEVDPKTGETIRQLPDTPVTVRETESSKRRRRSGGSSRSTPVAIKTPIEEPATKTYTADLRGSKGSSEPQLETRTLEVYKNSVQLDTGQRLTFEEYERKNRADMIARNIAIKRALPISTRGLPVDKGQIVLDISKVEKEPEPTRAQKIWKKINTPLDPGKVPIVGDQLKKAQSMTYLMLAAPLAREKIGGQKMQQSSNPVVKNIGKIRSGAADFEADVITWFDKEIRTPSTWALAATGSLLAKGAGAAVKGIPVLSKVAANPAAQKVVKGGLLALYGGVQAKEIKEGRKTLGQVVGETGAYMTAYSFVDPAINKVIDVSKAGVQSYKNWRADVNYQKWQKSITGDEFRLSEGAQGAQRTLTGGSLSDKQVQQAIRDLNKNKLGFGIEQNTLRPYKQDVLPTGQTKLSRDQIIAIDSLGNVQNVKVVNQQPFVYDPKLRTYVEYDPSKYFLRTVKTSPMGDPDRVSKALQQLRNTFTIKPSTQTQLPTTPTTKKPTLPFNTKSSAPSFDQSGSLPNVVSSGVKATQIDRAALSSFQIPKTQAIPNYVVDTGAVAQAPIAQNKGGISVLLPKIGITPKPQFDTVIKASVKPTQLPSISSGSKPRQNPLDDILKATREAIKPSVIPDISTGQSQRPRSGTTPRTQPVFDVLPIVTPSPSPPRPPTPTPLPQFGVFEEVLQPVPPQVPGLPAWYFGKSKPRGFPGARRGSVKQPRAFFPTLKSNILAEFGKTQKLSISSGLGERFIPKKKKKGRGTIF